MMDTIITPNGTFETVGECPFCGSADIVYIEKTPHIEAKCGYCGRFIKFVRQFTNDNWARAVKERDGYVCQRCGKMLVGREAHAHHQLPTWFMPERRFDMANGITLCTACHKQIHGKGGTIKEGEDSDEA